MRPARVTAGQRCLGGTGENDGLRSGSVDPDCSAAECSLVVDLPAYGGPVYTLRSPLP